MKRKLRDRKVKIIYKEKVNLIPRQKYATTV